jgi:glycosyltransferase involved in cell wall biosynthesis
MRVALVHDWLTGMRGGEKVLEVLCERYPAAELFTLVHVPGTVSPVIERLRIHTSALQHLPGAARYYRQYLPLFPRLIESFRLRDFDLIISSSHCVAKSVIVEPEAVHLCYCHTPMRYAWDQFDAYFGPARLGAVPSAIMRRVMDRLARWDRETAGRVRRFVTNSRYVAQRIRRYYNREASVVYPPVDTVFFRPAPLLPIDRHCLVVSALVPYKRIEVAIEACGLAGVPLRIVGQGPERATLERRASASGANVTFLGRLPDEAVRDEYSSAALVLMPGEEDFGIVPLEAQSCGRPVVAYARGGALESIRPDETGLLVEDDAPQAFAAAIERGLARSFDSTAIRRHAETFGRDRFGDAITSVVDETIRDRSRRAW